MASQALGWAGFRVGERVRLCSHLAELIPQDTEPFVTVVGFHPTDPLFPIDIQLPGGLVVHVSPRELEHACSAEDEEA